MLELIYDYFSKNTIETVGAILTILCVWLNTKANIWGWFVGILSTICYIYVAYSTQLWGFCLLNIFFLAISVYGLWNWKYGTENKIQTNEIQTSEIQILPITHTPATTFIILIGFGTILSGVFSYILIQTGSSSPYFDAIIFAFSIIAQGLLANKKIENWLFWIVINLLTVVMFLQLKIWITAILYIMLFILAIRGYLEWIEIKKHQIS